MVDRWIIDGRRSGQIEGGGGGIIGKPMGQLAKGFKPAQTKAERPLHYERKRSKKKV